MKAIPNDDIRELSVQEGIARPVDFSALRIGLNVAALGLVCFLAARALYRPLEFDDAFMFHRYAMHLREGMGISWNPDGIHTGGMTSLGWFFVVFFLSFLPLLQGQFLALGSFVVGLAGIVWIALQVGKSASSSALRRSFWWILSSMVLLLGATKLFRANMITGMDTMLSFAMDAALSCSIWAWCVGRGKGVRLAALVGILGAGAIIVRPENGLLAVLAPLLAALLLLDRSRRAEVLWAALSFAGVLAVFICLYRSYFHAWLPLSFYMKSHHPYLGYVGAAKWSPEEYVRRFLLLGLVISGFPLMCLERRSLRIGLTYLLPLAFTFLYLETVTQIMGSESRYYVPFLGAVLVAAFWMSDVSLQGDWRALLLRRRRAIVVFVLVLVGVTAATWRPLERWSERRLQVTAFAAPRFTTPSASELPEKPWLETVQRITYEILAPLPAASTIAASEVGRIGAAAPRVAVIDLAGLNDNEIALRGFHMERLLARRPLLIWFPHGDYTWQRRVMFCDPGLMQHYTVIGGDAFNFSLAIRRDVPETPEMMQHVDRAFQELYPGLSMKDYIVSSIDCTA